MDDKIHTYRQPFVTATGIILGFIFNYTANFTKSDNAPNLLLSSLISLCMVIGVICHIIVLKRILAMDYPRESAEQYYNQTLRLFLIGVSISFTGILIDTCASVIG